MDEKNIEKLFYYGYEHRDLVYKIIEKLNNNEEVLIPVIKRDQNEVSEIMDIISNYDKTNLYFFKNGLDSNISFLNFLTIVPFSFDLLKIKTIYKNKEISILSIDQIDQGLMKNNIDFFKISKKENIDLRKFHFKPIDTFTDDLYKIIINLFVYDVMSFGVINNSEFEFSNLIKNKEDELLYNFINDKINNNILKLFNENELLIITKEFKKYVKNNSMEKLLIFLANNFLCKTLINYEQYCFLKKEIIKINNF